MNLYLLTRSNVPVYCRLLHSPSHFRISPWYLYSETTLCLNSLAGIALTIFHSSLTTSLWLNWLLLTSQFNNRLVSLSENCDRKITNASTAYMGSALEFSYSCRDRSSISFSTLSYFFVSVWYYRKKFRRSMIRCIRVFPSFKLRCNRSSNPFFPSPLDFLIVYFSRFTFILFNFGLRTSNGRNGSSTGPLLPSNTLDAVG